MAKKKQISPVKVYLVMLDQEILTKRMSDSEEEFFKTSDMIDHLQNMIDVNEVFCDVRSETIVETCRGLIEYLKSE